MPASFSFLSWKNLVHGISLPSLDFAFDVPSRTQNLQKLTSELKLDSSKLFFPWIRQVHGTRIQILKEDFPSEKGEITFPETDGIITNQTEVFLSVLSADCVPVFFKSADLRVIGMAHVGWRGAQQGLIQKMIEAFKVHFSVLATSLQIGIGPCIQKCCYEIKDDVAHFFPQAVEERKKAKFLNLPRFIQGILEEKGVNQRQIENCGKCTFCDAERFFSYRRDSEASGRQMAFLMKP